MKTFYSAFFLTLLVAACGDNQPADTTVEKPAQNSSVMKCYTYTGNRDTITLKTVSVNGLITGTLVYNLYEKDRNQGTIQGEIKDNLLVADYTFTSEGTQSVRQVAFKISGNKLTEGYGEVDMNGQKASFKNLDSLSFSNSIVLSETECKE